MAAKSELRLVSSIPPGTLAKGGRVRVAWNAAATHLCVCGNTGARGGPRGDGDWSEG